MRQKTLEYLESHSSETPSKWRDDAEWRRDNRDWLHYSRRIAVILLSYMKRENLTQSAMADRMDCTQQYVSKILRGTENLSLETLTKLEAVTGERLIDC